MIPFQDYQRLFNTIYTVLSTETEDVHRTCKYFSVIGALILSEQYSVDARPVGGIAAYKIGALGDEILAFAEVRNNSFMSTMNGHHFWIQADGWLIDFMAPLFPELVRDSEKNYVCERKMLQKEMRNMSSSIGQMSNVGDFYLEPDTELTNLILQDFMTHPKNLGLAEICTTWYQKPPREMKRYALIDNQYGDSKRLSLSGPSVTGVW